MLGGLTPKALAHSGFFKTVIKPEFRGTDRIKVCAACKKCAEACPTGALRII